VEIWSTGGDHEGFAGTVTKGNLAGVPIFEIEEVSLTPLQANWFWHDWGSSRQFFVSLPNVRYNDEV